MTQMVVKLRVDLSTNAGRAAMRAFVDALDAEAAAKAAPCLRPSQAQPGGGSGGTAEAGAGPQSEDVNVGGDFCPDDPDDVGPEVYPPQPVPVDLIDDAASAVSEPDPMRPWTPELRWAAWSMYEAGLKAKPIAERIGLGYGRVNAFLRNVKSGAIRRPTSPESSTAVVVAAAPAGALAVAERRPAQDQDMRAARLEEMREAEAEKFVARSLYPEMQR